MKITVGPSVEAKKTYPYIGQNDAGYIVLFTTTGSGVILQTPYAHTSYKAGSQVDGITETGYKRVEGTLTVSYA